jgi:hypothetical protein
VACTTLAQHTATPPPAPSAFHSRDQFTLLSTAHPARVTSTSTSTTPTTDITTMTLITMTNAATVAMLRAYAQKSIDITSILTIIRVLTRR